MSLFEDELHSSTYAVGRGGYAAIGVHLHEYVEVALGLRYTHFPFGSDSLSSTVRADNPQGYKEIQVAAEGGDLSLTGIEVDVKAKAPFWRIRPYLLTGVGGYITENEPLRIVGEPATEIDITSSGAVHRAIGVPFGGGLDVELAPGLASFLELRHLWNLSSDNRSYSFGRIGVILAL